MSIIKSIFAFIFNDNSEQNNINRRNRIANQSNKFVKVKHNNNEKKYRINKYGEVFEVQ